MRARRKLVAALATATALASPVASAAPAGDSREPSRAKSCGTYASTSIYDRAKVIAIRGVGCKEAKKVARRFDQKGKETGPWRCGLAHGGGRALFSCGYPAVGGDLRDSKHALKAKGMGPPS